MIAAPRCCTVAINSPCNQASSVMRWVAGWPSIRALVKSGYWVAEWLPQMATLVTAVTATPALRASWALARFSSRRVIAKKRSRGTPAELCMAMRQFVLQGLPTTKTRTSLAAFRAIA